MAKTKRRNLSAKQIRAGFGGKRRKAAAKSRPKHRARTKAAAPRKKRRAAVKSNPAPRKRKRAVAKRSPVKRRRNPELVSFLLGNPAKRSTKKMAKTRKRKRAVSRSNAGTRRRATKRTTRRTHRHRSNPGGIGNATTILFGGAGVLGGFVGSAALPQMVLGAGNTGVAGYAATAAAGIGLAMLAHYLFPRKPAIAMGVGMGAAANVIRRVISDNTPYGPFLSNNGMGDYMVANWGPPRMNNGLFSAMAEAPGTQWNAGGSGMITSSGVGIQDMADIRSARPC